MKTILATLLTVLFLLPVSAFGEIQTITHTVKQSFGGSQSPDDARISAVAKAKREALEMAGTYIESLTVVKNYQVDKDEILALSAGVLKVEVVSQKNYASEDAFGIEIVVNVVVDTSVLEGRVRRLLEDRTHLKQLKDSQKIEKELLQKVAQLEDENRKLMAKNQSTEKLKKEFQQASEGLTAMDWFNKADSLRGEGKYTDPKKVIEYLNNAIKLKPDYFSAYFYRGMAYSNLGQHKRAIEDYNQTLRLQPNDALTYVIRGMAYFDLGQHKRAIEDYNQALRLQPNDASTYVERGLAYDDLGQHQRAIEDYNEAIRLKPDYVLAYNFRGGDYAYLGQYHRAIKDYTEAIRLKPDLATAYRGRGIAYKNLGQYQSAIEDYNKLIRLKPDDAGAYVSRGFTYGSLNQYQRAIEDYNEAIRLKPDYAVAYRGRGIAYLFQGNNKLGCRDAQKACALGECATLEMAKGEGKCR